MKQNGLFIVLYGPSKAGKSTASGAVGACGKFIAQAGGLLPLQKFLGLTDVEYQSPKIISEASTQVTKWAGKTPSIVLDDFSLLVEQTVLHLEKKHSFGDMWRQLRTQVLGMRDAARSATEKGTHVIFNCHASPPRTSSGKYVRGGPAMPGQLPEQFSAFADIVAKAEYEETASPWKYILRTGPSAEHISGDRLGIFPDPAPFNIAEALRAADIEIARPEYLQWQTKVVKVLSDKILSEGLETYRETLTSAGKNLLKKYPMPHVKWALQDSLHRAVIQSKKQSSLDTMFEDPEDGW